jgi:hypothetical protein
MTHRIKNLGLITFLFGLLILSLGYNCLLTHRLNCLCESIEHANYWVSPHEYQQMEAELNRLETTKYTN